MRTVRAKKLKKVFSLGMALILTVGMIPFRIFAAEAPTATAVLEVESQIIGDDTPEDAEFTFVLTADDAGTPMPSSDRLTIRGSSTGKFEPITYDRVGVYTYTVHQQDGQLPDYTYDQSVYHVTVTVINTDDGNLSAGMFAQRNDESAKSGDVVFRNEYQAPETESETTLETETEPQTETELETEKPKVSMTFEKIDAATGDGLSGAVLRVVDENGAIVDEWTSNASIHTIKNQLIDGETYRLVELNAPSGYKFAKDIEFTAEQDAQVVMSDEKKPENQKENGFVSVTKQLICNGDIIGARDQVFYVALYEDPECTYRVTEIKALEFKMASEVTAVFDGLEPGTTYYIGESDGNGVSIESGKVDDGTIFYTDFVQGQEVTAAVQAETPNIAFENDFLDIPREFYREGKVIVTKKLVDEDGNEKESTETFNAGIFDDPEFTTLSSQVLTNVLELQMNGASEVSAIVRVVLTDNTTTNLYVTEVDANGIPVSQDADFAYDVTVEGSSVSLDASNTIAETTITNQELPEETEPESTPETTPQTETESESESETESETQTELQTEVQTESQTTPQTEKQTTSQTEKQTTTSVKTGDETPVTLYVTLLAAAAVILIVSLELKRRKNKRS
jgi:pilin isopeptide linkage protein